MNGESSAVRMIFRVCGEGRVVTKMWPFLGWEQVQLPGCCPPLLHIAPHCPTVPPIQGAMVPTVQWLVEGDSPSLGHGLPGWTPEPGGSLGDGAVG